jgi:acetyltransferase-like isoleucine patch superfamily enzyme
MNGETSGKTEPQERTPIAHAVQEAIHGQGHSPLRTYALLAVGEPSLPKLLVYDLVTSLFGGWPGVAGYALRRLFYAGLFGEMGPNVTIGRNGTFRGMGRIRLGASVCIDDNCVVDARGPEASIRIGREVFIGRNTVVRSRGGTMTIGERADIGCHCLVATDSRLEVGKDVLVAAYTYIAAGGAWRYDDKTVPIKQQGFKMKGGSRIGDGAWIGAHTLILDGVTIGNGTIVGAHSMVNKSLPDMAVAWGVPAQVQRMR